MSGLICHSVRAAALQFPAVPTDPTRVPAFDCQLRELYANPIIAAALGAITPSPLTQAIPLLEKASWTTADRTTLYDIVESLYE
jgi:hypothetical protein